MPLRMAAGWLLFQPTRPLRGATDSRIREFLFTGISTHAPLAGRDWNVIRVKPHYDISTHAPLAGRDPLPPQPQNTNRKNFNPRAPCGARPICGMSYFPTPGFQPTRPLRGATEYMSRFVNRVKFQPTRPLRGATVCVQDGVIYDS